jgi:hypothetical protein
MNRSAAHASLAGRMGSSARRLGADRLLFHLKPKCKIIIPRSP